jgi:recombinational DNA repair protein (RecF pathway)
MQTTTIRCARCRRPVVASQTAVVGQRRYCVDCREAAEERRLRELWRKTNQATDRP